MGFQRDVNKIYIPPIVFGPALCQLQDATGEPYEGIIESVDRYSVIYQVVPDKLFDLLPVGYESKDAVLIISVEVVSNIAWLANRGLVRVEVQTPVFYKGKSGVFNMVTWENNGDSILCGRDIFGMPKIYARIDYSNQGSVFEASAASWEFDFLSFTVDKEKPPGNAQACEELWRQQYFQNTFRMTYRPMTGDGFTKKDACYTTVVKTDKIKAKPQLCSGFAKWSYPQFEDTPTQYRILQALSDLTPQQVLGAGYISFDRMSDGIQQQILD